MTMDKAASLRRMAARIRDAAAYADGQAYHQDMERARELEWQAEKIEKAEREQQE